MKEFLSEMKALLSAKTMQLFIVIVLLSTILSTGKGV